MGSGSFSSVAYRSFSSSTVGKSTDQIYTSRTLDPYLDPKGIKVRESRDSAEHPQSTPVIVALDVTGSMGILADNIARDGLGVLFTGILDRKPIPDPQVMFMGVGDANFDRFPLQVSQFESDNRIVEQLTKLYLEHGGGGNDFESYDLPWYFAGFHTAIDSYEKRGKRGYLFTVGDEEFPRNLTAAQIKSVIGDTVESNMSTDDILLIAQRKWDIYHVIIEEGNYASSYPDAVRDSWTKRLGQHVIPLSDHTKLAQTIVSAIEVAEGRSADVSASGWGAAGGIVHRAVQHLPSRKSPPLLGGGA